MNELYRKHLREPTEFTTNLWGTIPNSIAGIGKFLESHFIPKDNFFESNLKELKTIIKQTHLELGVYTNSTRSLLNYWDSDTKVVEIGHQPLYLGGGSFIFNKISFTIGLAEELNKQSNIKSVPILFIGDHDQIQNELVITRFPQAQSFRGLTLKSTNYEKSISTPISYVAKPDENEFLDQQEKIRSNYRELIKYSKIKGHYRPLLEERLESALDLLYDTYLESKTLGDWTTKFWAKLFIIRNNAPILILKASDPQLRLLLKPYIDDLLIDENRKNLIKTLNVTHEKLAENGFTPGISIREMTDSPFLYECQACPTKNRVRLTVHESSLEGICPSCNTPISIEYDKKNPDLANHYKALSPKVEARSIIINQLLNDAIRITGGGETTYHAQIIPYLAKRKIHYPLIIRHPRIFYNTPWAEKTSTVINFDNLPILHTSEMFKRMSLISKSKDFNELFTYLEENKMTINEIYSNLSSKEQDLVSSLKKSNNKKLQRKLDLIQLYLSQSFGKYDNHKSIQEVSWNWIDLVVLTGIKDVVGFYQRRIKPHVPIASTFWISAGKFN